MMRRLDHIKRRKRLWEEEELCFDCGEPNPNNIIADGIALCDDCQQIDFEFGIRREEEEGDEEGNLCDAIHDCWENAIAYEEDGPLGHGFECSVCGQLLQVG
uniref:Uncharacterized protein n=1 Tax=viral metagenome TaxID=1070528 RepID=A0A6M3KBH1_9ZZZZ